jgi:prepilin-type N-terminal cleavage/methylation domain-containing protein
MISFENRGFTLTELLVAMAMSLTVLAGLYMFYVTHQRAYAVQAQLLETHQNLRIALEIIVEDIQGTGGTGIPPVAAVTLTNSTTGSDSLSLLVPGSSICPEVPQPVQINTYHGSGSHMFLADTCIGMEKKLVLLVDATGLNYRNLILTKVLTVNDKVEFESSPLPVLSASGLTTDYTGGTMVFLRQVTYTVDVSNPAEPVLKQNLNTGGGAQPMANYIEDLQVTLGYDKNSDGIITEVGNTANDDETIFNVPGESNATEAPTNLRTVKVILVGRTRTQDPELQGSLPAILDRVEGGPDGFRRKTRGARTQIRNLGV